MSGQMSTTDAIRTPVANHSAESEASATAPPPAPVKGKKRKNNAEIPKSVQKKLDTLLAKVEKLTKANKKLKEEAKTSKAATTRIHRIPKSM